MTETMKVVSMGEEKTKKARWPVDCCLERIDEFEEILVLAKVRGEERYVRFSSALQSTFWWIGVLEAMKRNFLDESVFDQDEE